MRGRRRALKGCTPLKAPRHPRNPRYQLGTVSSLLLAVALTGAITLLCLWVQPTSLRSTLSVFRAQPLLIVLNCLPIGLLVLAFSLLYRNVFSAASLIGACTGLLSVVNRIKIEVRDEPLFPRDFSLLKEALSGARDYSIHLPWGALGVIAVFTLLCVALGRLVGCRPGCLFGMKRLLHRLCALGVSAGLLVGVIFTLCASDGLYASFAVSNPYKIPTVFNELGFPYCFCHQFTTYGLDRPEGFSRSAAAAWETGDRTGEGKNVSVVMVMDEAFSDLTDEAAFTYSEDDDPLMNLHALQKDPHCISGHVVVPGFAGGTANTEFDVLTGMQTNALASDVTSAFRMVNRNLDSLFRVFSGDGYETLFMHPGYAWFYNRENVYKWLGADQILFAADMEGLRSMSSWVTDDSMADQIEQRFETAAAAGTPLFNYTVTIQNHMSYTADKYGAGYSFDPVQTSAQLSDEVRTMLSVYTKGVRDADAMLGRLQTYFSQREEPVVLVFWGDHLPYLGDARLGYAELDADAAKPEAEQQLPFSAYRTPYVIWANDAAADTLDWDRAAAGLELPEDGTISACYLGSAVLELTGRGEENPWFSYLAQARRELPVIQNDTYRFADGTVGRADQLTDADRKLLSRLRCWSYYKLRYKNIQ